jgi:hypothetical protein
MTQSGNFWIYPPICYFDCTNWGRGEEAGTLNLLWPQEWSVSPPPEVKESRSLEYFDRDRQSNFNGIPIYIHKTKKHVSRKSHKLPIYILILYVTSP